VLVKSGKNHELLFFLKTDCNFWKKYRNAEKSKDKFSAKWWWICFEVT